MRELVIVASGWAMHYLAHSAVILAAMGAAAWLGDRLLRRVGPGAQHRMWVAALLMGVAMPLVPAGWLPSLGHAGVGAADGTAAVTYHRIAAAAERWSVWPLLVSVVGIGYLAVVGFCVARLVWRWVRTRAMARRSMARRSTEPALDARAHELIEDAARQAGVAMPRVCCSAEVNGPVVLGWRPLLIVPEGFFAAPEEDIAAALAHECAHIGRWDFAKNLIYEVAAVSVAYHPATRLMRRRIAETRELVCDEMAAGAREDRAEYAASLLRLARAMAAPAAVTGAAIGVFDGDILEERIMRLTVDVPKVRRVRRIAMTTVAACALLGSAAGAMALPFDVTPQSATQEKVYKIGGDVKPPVLIHAVDAEFSKKAKAAKFQGVSVVSCIVGTDGLPHDVHTARKLGMGLDEKAIEAVRQYRFKPSTLHGKPVAVALTIEVSFRQY